MMLNGIPNLRYFENMNQYSGQEGGMRYCLTPAKAEVPNGEAGEGATKRAAVLRAVVWPDPWSEEHTAEEKKTRCEEPLSEEGRKAVLAWLHRQYEAQPGRWQNLPSILDCEPDC